MIDLPEQFSPERLVDCMREHSRKPTDALPEGVIEALRLAHALSLEREEDRPLRVALALTRTGQSLPSERVLQDPVTTFDAIRHLCPAATRERMCMRFGRTKGSEWGVLSIAGRPDMGGPVLAHSFWGQIALAEALAPGRVALEIGDDVVRYERGRYAAADPIPHIRMLAPQFMAAKIADYASPLSQLGHALYLGGSVLVTDEAAYATHRAAFEAEVRETASIVASDGIYFLAEYTNQLHHGGTLLFVSDPHELMANSGSNLVAARHVFNPTRHESGTQKTEWNAGMLDALGWEVHRRLAAKSITILPLNDRFAGAGGLEKWRREVAAGRIESALRRWRQEAQMCAELTQIDGAVMFNALLSPCALGVKFLRVTDEAVAMLSDAFRQEALGRGMRHQSAACLVDALPNSLALVVSQDGGVTAFAHSATGEKTCKRLL